MNVVDCFAHDGTGEVTQRLTDGNGCPIDESIMLSLELLRDEEEEQATGNEISWDQGEESSPPTDTPEKADTLEVKNKPKIDKPGKNSQKFRRKKPDVNVEGNRSKNVELIPEEVDESSSQKLSHQNEKMNLQVVGTMFSAFKFPDAANLHLKCTLEICKEFCQKASCDQDAEETINRAGKSLRKKEQGDVIEKIEVFNSVEVIAPGIDNDGFSNDGGEHCRKSAGAFFFSEF